MKLHSMISCHIGANPCWCGSSILQYNDLSLTSIISLLLLLSTDSVRAQSIRPSGSQDDPYYNKFGPSMGVIIIILISALFFMAFFFIYLRRYSSTAAAARNLGSVARSRPNQEGLDPTVIESFPTFDYSAVRGLHIGNGAFECAVCLNEFEDDETLRLIPKCDHVFHSECVDDWLVAHPTCPLCRANLVPQPGEFIHALELGQIREHSSDQDGAAVGFPDQQYGSHHQSVNANVDEESVEHPLHTPPPQPGVADFSTRRLNRNRTRRNISGRRPKWFDRFLRSNSTGHVAVKQWENLVRLTLKVVEQIGKQTMSGKLSRSTSLVGLPRESSSRRGYRPGFGGGVGEGSGRGGSFTWRLDRYSSRPVHGRPADAAAQGLRSRRAADFNIFYTKPYGPGFGDGVGEGSGRGRRFTGRLCGYASRQVQGRTTNTAAQGLRFRRASDSGIFYSTPHRPAFGRGIGERSGWGGRIIRPLDGYASRPVHSRPADTAAQGQRFPRACDLGIFYSTTYRPGFGGGVGEGSGRGGGPLKGYTNRSEQSRSTSSAAQSFLSCRASDSETSYSTRSQASFDRGVGEGSSRSTGTAAKNSDSEISFITCRDGRSRGRLDRYAGVSNQSRSTGNAAKDSGSKISYSTSTTRHMKTKYRK